MATVDLCIFAHVITSHTCLAELSLLIGFAGVCFFAVFVCCALCEELGGYVLFSASFRDLCRFFQSVYDCVKIDISQTRPQGHVREVCDIVVEYNDGTDEKFRLISVLYCFYVIGISLYNLNRNNAEIALCLLVYTL